MPTISLPAAGKSGSPATVRRWLKKPGDTVHKGDILLEIELEDGLAQIDSPADGLLREILVPEGRTVPANAPVAVVGEGSIAIQVEQEKQAVENKPNPTGPAGKVVPILMPKAGQSMEEGTLIKWHVKPGAMITQGQVIFEIETDKANMDVEATDSGRLAKIVLNEGQTLKVLEPVAYLADKDEDVEAYLASAGAARPAEVATTAAGGTTQSSTVAEASPAPSVQAESGRIKASPAARRIAAERMVDLAAVGMGSGPGGRILSTDVPAAAKAPAAAPAMAQPIPMAPAPQGASRRRMSKMRKAIAANLQLSKQTIPHFYIRATINADPLMSFYQQEKAKYPCSINDVIILACARAIAQFPAFRSRIEGDEIVELPSVNIGLAVGMDEGLVVPVLMNVDQMDLRTLGVQTKRLATNAKSGKIEGIGEGVFTISNMGMLGVEEFAAIINPPEAAILAVGAVREEVIVSGGTLRPGRVMTMTLSVDHRVIDGMLAAKFMARLKELLEWPAQMS